MTVETSQGDRKMRLLGKDISSYSSGTWHATEPASVFSTQDDMRLCLGTIKKTAGSREGTGYLCEMKLFHTLHKSKKVRPCSERAMGWEISTEASRCKPFMQNLTPK